MNPIFHPIVFLRFQRHCGLSDTNSNVTSAADLLKQDRVARSASSSAAPTTATTVAVTVSASEDGGTTPTNFSPLVTPKVARITESYLNVQCDPLAQLQRVWCTVFCCDYEKARYRVTIVVSGYILLTLFLQFHNVPQKLCNFCRNRIGQTVEQPKRSQQSLVTDCHGHPGNTCPNFEQK